MYKNLQRKFERVRLAGAMDVSFSLHGTKVELNFPKSDRFSPVDPPEESSAFDPKRIDEVVQTFRTRMESLVSDSKIVMMRDRMPRTWEEKTIVRLGKCLWIPSTAEDFPGRDPFPDERVITKSELIKLEEEAGRRAHVITSKLGNILYEKTKKDIVAELWCPVLYNEYVVGYVHVWNTGPRGNASPARYSSTCRSSRGSSATRSSPTDTSRSNTARSAATRPHHRHERVRTPVRPYLSRAYPGPHCRIPTWS